MAENSDNRKKNVLLLAIVGALIVYLIWFLNIFDRETVSTERINEFEKKVLRLELLLHATPNRSTDAPIVIIESELDENHELKYIDLPSQYPRMPTSGVFPSQESSFEPHSRAGRGDRDMNDVAILVESTNWNDSVRMVNTLIAQRKSEKDLKIFLYSPTHLSGLKYDNLKLWSNLKLNVMAINETDMLSAASKVLKTSSSKYVIMLSDYKYIGDDFADFYFVGKSIMESDRNIRAVCGTSNGAWQDRQLGDVMWLTETPCESGEMITIKSLRSPNSPRNRIRLRPEMARVGGSEKSVTHESEWNIDRFNPLLMRQHEFWTRLDLDLANAEKKPLKEWVSHSSNCNDDIFMFPYESDEDLKVYFTHSNITALHRYKGILSLSTRGCRAYIVPKLVYEKNYPSLPISE